MAKRTPLLIALDVEAWGPDPTKQGMVSLGAALVDNPQARFYEEIDPYNTIPIVEKTQEIHGLNYEDLQETGTELNLVMQRFNSWIELAQYERGHRPGSSGMSNIPIPVAIMKPAGFDWPFIQAGYDLTGIPGAFGKWHSNVMDFRTWVAGTMRVSLFHAGKKQMKGWLRKAFGDEVHGPPHTHRADEDAAELAHWCRLVLKRQVQLREEEQDLQRLSRFAKEYGLRFGGYR